MKSYTYQKHYQAHYGTQIVTVPDQVASDQRGFAARHQSFPAFLRPSGRKVRVQVHADATGLWSTGTGDLVVRSA
jgi:hypothetical protein